nr:hypothetical protein BaRGS_008323 [Batillaria attramentaria]
MSMSMSMSVSVNMNMNMNMNMNGNGNEIMNTNTGQGVWQGVAAGGKLTVKLGLFAPKKGGKGDASGFGCSGFLA